MSSFRLSALRFHIFSRACSCPSTSSLSLVSFFDIVSQHCISSSLHRDSSNPNPYSPVVVCSASSQNMTLPDRYPPLNPIQRQIYVPPPYPDRSPPYRGPTITDIEAVVRNVERLDDQWQRWAPNDDRYENEYVASSTDASISERLEPSPPFQNNAPFYVPRSPPAVVPHPSYQRGDFRPELEMGLGLNQNQGYE